MTYKIIGHFLMLKIKLNNIIFPLMQFMHRYYFISFEKPQYKCKKFDACIVLSCHRQKCCTFANIDYFSYFVCETHSYLLLTNNTALAGVDKFLSSRTNFRAQKNGWSRPKYTSDGDSTRNIALCFLPTQRTHHVESTWIRRGYYVDTSKTKSLRISTSFPRTFSMWFWWSKNPRGFKVLFSM